MKNTTLNKQDLKEIGAEKDQQGGDANQNTLVVGIGASAGGIEALEVFFANVKPDSDCAYIVIQHLSPHFKSLMVEILEKHANIPICSIQNDMPIEKNVVYIAPPGKNITVYHNKLFTTDQDRSSGFWFPIDLFMESLADEYGDHCAGIILSGTGSDGTHGGRLIKEKGGLFVVQDPDSAKFNGMPKSAIRTGLVDQVLHVEEIPDFLLRFQVILENKTRKEEAPEQLQHVEGLDRIMSILKRQFKIDFNDYKSSTIVRRIEHRMGINLVPTFDDYARSIAKSSTEALTLYRELLIGVTRFFRDKEAYEALKKIIPKLFEKAENRPTQAIRVWVAGCSTGEEAYSLAILLHDYSVKFKQKYFDIKVFATDADQEAITYAGAGTYPLSIAADIPPELLGRYFIKEGDHLRIVREIRQKVVFAPHDLINNAPFSRIDLVTCRNVLIYFKADIQQQVIKKLAYSLSPDGYLFLGSSENLGNAASYFKSINPTYKVYKFIGPERPSLTPEIAGRSRAERTLPAYPAFTKTSTSGKSSRIMFSQLMYGVLGDYIPDSVIIDRNMRVLFSFGNSTTYMQMPTGQVDMSIINLVNPGIQAALGSAIQQAIVKKEKIIYEKVQFTRDQEEITFNLVIEPNVHGSQVEWLLIIFDGKRKKPIEDDETKQTFESDRHTAQRIQDLEYRLEFTEESLQATIEELETSNEELQATNEELMAANEELQSTNEELHSTNEELVTVNAEYHAKIKEMSQLTDDIDNILRCSDIGMLFLDEELKVRRFSAAGKNPFVELTAQDVGRPFAHFSHRVGEINLLKMAKEALDEAQPIDREVHLESGQWYLLRVYPYITHMNIRNGVVISFVEITAIKTTNTELAEAVQREKTARQALRESEERLAHVLDMQEEGVVYCRTMKGRREITFVSSNVDILLGYSAQEFIKNPGFWLDKIHPDDQKKASSYFKKLASGPKGLSPLEFRFKCMDGKYKWVRDETKMILDDTHYSEEILGYWMDITDEKMG